MVSDSTIKSISIQMLGEQREIYMVKNDPELDQNISGVLCTHYGKLN